MADETNDGDKSTYSSSTESLDAFGKMLQGLIEELLRHNKLQYHSVRYRVKTRESVEGKLSDRDKYESIDDLTDLLGLRVITYFSDDVDAVAGALEPEFKIDRNNSVDKRKEKGPDQFGYMSMHYVALLNSARSGLPENSRFKGLRFELQIRSILQHAWAEIEHDLGYKSEFAIPNQFKRRFSLLAGLLESADDEFVRLRTERLQYEANLGSEISERPKVVAIDQSTIAKFIAENPIVAGLDADIAKIPNFTLRRVTTRMFAGNRAADLRAVGVDDIGTLESFLSEHRDEILRFAQNWVDNPSKAVATQRGAALSFVVYMKLGALDGPPEQMIRETRSATSLHRLFRRSKTVLEEVQRTP
ncbi:GTP pyrophosphokinase [Cellulosimicrobium aquatile]|uniref:GTP pyrophosphokinase n=1 Tax=Cellulosimicrobium aquatile TaxID=1612203 RepID=UPI00145940AA|nr:hypothetical protein [Cellulosimicrobium aquatile]NMF27909.1 hypothetical protein [Cellulosimicrobium aquatile]